MNEGRLRDLAARFAAALPGSADLARHVQEHRRRVQRAQTLLTLVRVPALSADELRELFFDSDAFGFWSNKDWEFNHRLQAVGLTGLRDALLELVSRAQLGMTHDDLRVIWEMRGLGRLLATELLAYRFPDRYWIYSPSVTLPALAALGDDVKDAQPRGQRSDPHVYLALAPRMMRVRAALDAAGVEPADNLMGDTFLWWVKTTVGDGVADPSPVPEVQPAVIEQALRAFDRDRRTAWEALPRREYALRWQGRQYPLREIVRAATGVADVSAAAARSYVQKRGFQLASTRAAAAGAASAEPAAETGAGAGAAGAAADASTSTSTNVGALLLRAVATRGLHFTRWQLATFYTALQVKGFVVLSGISGTGKTKLAQRFAEILPQPEDDTAAGLPPDAIAVTVQPYMLRYGRVIVPRQATRLFDPPVADEGRDVVVAFDGQRETCQFVRASYAGREYLSLTLRGALRAWFARTFTDGDAAVLEPEIDHDDMLVGFRLSPRAAWRAAGAAGRNWLFVAVRPDWRDSKGLLGYFNPLTRAYEWTPFLRFLLRAAQSYRTDRALAWVVLLDEMNLAHVEHYFADLLSVLESGRDENGYTREPLAFVYPDDAEGDLPPRELKLPPNVYVVGTVNVDETTHALSPKVLDRAFTLELTEADFRAYPPEDLEAGDELDPRERRALLAAFTQGGRFAQVDKRVVADYVARHPEVRARLARLGELLRPFSLHFGYRVFDEMVSFVAAAESTGLFAPTADGTVAGDPFDAAVLMKVLPKFHGSRARLEAPLRAVLAFCLDPDAPAEQGLDDALRDAETADDVAAALGALGYRLPHTAERARRMLRSLYAEGFAAFG